MLLSQWWKSWKGTEQAPWDSIKQINVLNYRISSFWRTGNQKLWKLLFSNLLHLSIRPENKLIKRKLFFFFQLSDGLGSKWDQQYSITPNYCLCWKYHRFVSCRDIGQVRSSVVGHHKADDIKELWGFSRGLQPLHQLFPTKSKFTSERCQVTEQSTFQLVQKYIKKYDGWNSFISISELQQEVSAQIKLCKFKRNYS